MSSPWSPVRPPTREFPILLVAAAFLVPLGLLYVLSYVSPAIQSYLLTGRGTGDGKFLFDSMVYYETAQRLTFSQLFAPMSMPEGVRGLGLTNLALYAQGKFAIAAFPWEPSVGVFLLNVLLMGVGVRNALSIARELGLKLSMRARLMFFLNPAVLLMTVSLTKEAWGIALMTSFSLAAVRHRWINLAVLGILSLVVREYYAAVALSMGLLTRPRLRPWVFLLLVAFLMGVLESVLGFGDLTGYLTTRAVAIGAQTGALMSLMGQVQSVPFGHIIAFPVILAVNVAGPILNPVSYTTPADYFFLQANTISSYLSAGLIVVGVVRHWRWRDFQATAVIGRHLFAFAVLSALYPFSTHRYWIVAYPLLVVWALASAENSAREQRRSGSRGAVSATSIEVLGPGAIQDDRSARSASTQDGADNHRPVSRSRPAPTSRFVRCVSRTSIRPGTGLDSSRSRTPLKADSWGEQP